MSNIQPQGSRTGRGGTHLKTLQVVKTGGKPVWNMRERREETETDRQTDGQTERQRHTETDIV